MKDKPKFSLVVVGKNEAKTIPRLLGSLADFFSRGGEMVFVDTGSTDGTAKVARDAGCKVIEVGDRFRYVVDEQTAQTINNKFVVAPDEDIISGGDAFFAFDKARNFAMEQSSNDFICTPDCDEAWTNLDIDKINALIEQGYEKFLVDFVFSHNSDGTPSVEFSADTRFYDRRKIKWKGIIHETMQGEAKMARLPREVAYLEHYQNMETDRTKYLAGLAWACAVETNNDRNSHYFARELMYRGKYRSAIKEFERHVAMGAWLDERGQSVVYIGCCYEALGDNDKALEYWHKAYDLVGTRREPLIHLAQYWRKNNSPIRVASYAAAALEIPNNGFYGNRVANYTYEPHALMYWAKGWMADIPAARQHLLKCLEFHPTEERFLDDMQYYFTADEVKKARKRAGIVIEDSPSPIVSILMPAYNAEPFIAKAIESCQAQTLTDWELIIVNDGSKDGTRGIAQGYADRDGRVKVFAHLKNKLYPEATNTALSHAQGKYIARLDADDWDESTRLDKCVKRLESLPICDCVSTNYYYGEEGAMNLISTERQGMIPEKYMDFSCYGHGGAPVNAGIVAKREIYDAIGGFKTDSPYGMDSEWDVRANLYGARWAYIDEPLYYYRKHAGQTVIQQSREWYANQQKTFLDNAAPEWTNPFNPNRHIEVMVTGACNRSCQYCSQATYNEKYRDYQTPMELIDKLCRRSKEIGARYEWLQFSGGEPLLWDNLEAACAVAKESGAFKKIRVFSNVYETERLERVLSSGLVDVIYTNSTNASPDGCRILGESYPDKSIIAPLEHKPLPTSPLPGVLPARCNCNHPCVIENNVYPCGNFYEHVTRLGKNMADYKDYFCTLDDDWIGFFRKIDRFNMDICSYCLANGKVWEKVPAGEKV